MRNSTVLRLAVVIGVRPQYIKAAALNLLALDYYHVSGNYVQLIFFDTGQHYSPRLRPSFLTEIPTLGYRVIHTSRDSFGIFCHSIKELGDFLRSGTLDLDGVIVIGDANPTAVGALVASKLELPLVHIEAGARRDPREQEERNRRLADTLATLRFTVSMKGLNVLEEEGLAEDSLWTGDLWYKYLMSQVEYLPVETDHQRDEVLVTMHRPHNLTADVLGNLIIGLERLGRPVRWIVHPRTDSLIRGLVSRKECFKIEKPLSYAEVVRALLKSRYLISDSGGLIREAHHLKRRVLVRRDLGGWDELMDLGANLRLQKELSLVHEALDWAEHESLEPYPVLTPFRRTGGELFAFDKLWEYFG